METSRVSDCCFWYCFIVYEFTCGVGMSSYKNLKDKIKELTEQLTVANLEIQGLKDTQSYLKTYQEELEDEITYLKNQSWWSRLWDF